MIIERTKNTINGTLWGMMTKLITILLPFFARTIMIKTIGMDYVGLSGIFTSVLQVLSLSELGLGSAIVFCMYKPIADDDVVTVKALMQYMKKIYRIIGAVFLIIGMLLMPFLPYFISGSIPDNINIYVLYMVYLVNTSLSYFLFAYKSALLTAMQRNDLISQISFFTQLGLNIFQIIVLLVFKNFYLYVLWLPVFTLIKNIWISILVNKYYGEYNAEGEISKEQKHIIKSKLVPLIGTKVGAIVVNAADTIVISAFIGLTAAAKYNNYYFILNAVCGIILIIYSAMQAGIGNALVVDSHEKIMKDFYKLCFVNMWIVVWATSCLLVLYQPFICLWIGKDNLLSLGMVVLFCIYFYVHLVQRIVVLYKDAAGIWREDMVRIYIGNFVNIVLNIILVQFIGLYGVIGSSIIAFITIYPLMAVVLYKYVFKESSKMYYLRQLWFLLVAFCTCGGTYLCSAFLPNQGIGAFILKILLCCIVPNIILFIMTFWTKDFKVFSRWMVCIVSHMFRKN